MGRIRTNPLTCDIYPILPFAGGAVRNIMWPGLATGTNAQAFVASRAPMHIQSRIRSLWRAERSALFISPRAQYGLSTDVVRSHAPCSSLMVPSSLNAGCGSRHIWLDIDCRCRTNIVCVLVNVGKDRVWLTWIATQSGGAGKSHLMCVESEKSVLVFHE